MSDRSIDAICCAVMFVALLWFFYKRERDDG